MKVVPATPDLVPALLDRMGPERTAALAQRMGRDPVAEISATIKRSVITCAGLDKAGIVALGGAIPQGGDNAYVWQFITDGVRMNRRGYLAMNRAMVHKALARFRLLATLIKTTNPVALRHCRRLGFEIQPASVICGLNVHVCALRRTQVVEGGSVR